MTDKNILKKYIVLIVFFLISQPVFTISQSPNSKDTIYIGGFKVVILKNDQLDFFHAELVILYKTKDIGSVIPYITARTIFTKSLQSRSPISKSLRSLGNDYEVKFMADHLILKVNFLKKRFPKFVKFLSVLYKSNLLSEKDLIYEKKRIIEEYSSNEQFKSKMGVFSAYKFLFKDQILGNNFFTINQIRECKINHIIVHYKGTYIPENSSLYITGKVNTGRMIGYVKNFLRTIPKRFKQIIKEEKTVIYRMQRPVILNIPDILIPTILYLKVVTTNKKKNYISNIIINDILFKQNLINTINNKTLKHKFRKDLFVTTDIFNHRGLAVISNSVKIKYSSIENFIYLLNSEIRKIKMGIIDRRSYKRVFNYFYGRAKVDSRKYYSELDEELKRFLLNREEEPEKQESRNLLLKINNILNREKKDLFKSKRIFSKNETVVIIGDLNKILKYYPNINAEIVEIE